MQSDLEASLAQLISIPSASENAAACHEIIEYVRAQLEPLQLFITSDTDTDNPWLLATTHNTKEPTILLACHLDVVPAEPELFTMRKIDGKLIGRGVYDMKLAAACYLELVRKHGKNLKKLNIGFLFTTDEELTGGCMTSILETGLRPRVVFLPDGGGDWKIEERAKGLYNMEITARGKTAHGSRPWEGDNALHRLMDVLSEIRSHFPHQNPDMATLAVNKISGGTVPNQIADYAVARVDFRSFHKHDLDKFIEVLEYLAEEHDLELTIHQEGAPLLFNRDSPDVQRFLNVFEEQLGHPAEFISSYGASDARFFAQYDIPCIIMEPRGGARHSPDEWLLAEDLPAYYSLIEKWVFSSAPSNNEIQRTPNHAHSFHHLGSQ